MPSRLIREGILDSERIDKLDPPSEVFYRRLMSKVDDHGLFDARLSTLRTGLYPLRVDRVREADIARWIAACETAGVIALYENAGKLYGQMVDTRWQTRSQPKFPLPPWGQKTAPLTTESNRLQPPSNREQAPGTREQPRTSVHSDVVGVGVVGGDEVVVGDGGDNPPSPRREKSGRRELGPEAGFNDFWLAWPKSERKQDKAKCLDHWRKNWLSELTATIVKDIRVKRSTKKWMEGYDEAPLVYLRGRRWEDGVEPMPGHNKQEALEARGARVVDEFLGTEKADV